VCPSTIVGHWVGEINRFFSYDMFKTWAYTGSAKKRRENCEKKLSECNIVVTSYAVLRNDVEWLSSQRWNYVVLDEVR
jgi:TATA-binding protein-associated factor